MDRTRIRVDSSDPAPQLATTSWKVRARRIVDRLLPAGRFSPEANRRLLMILLGAGAIVTIATFWSLLTEMNRGLDISDEGTYLAHAQPYSRTVGMSSFYGRYTSLLLSAAGNDVARFRVLGLIIVILAGAICGAGLVAMVTAARRQRLSPAAMTIGALVGVNGALLYYFPHVLTPSYNWMVLASVLWTLGWLGLWWAGVMLAHVRFALVAATQVATGVFLAGMAKSPAGPALLVAAVIVAGVGAWMVGNRRVLTRQFALPAGLAFGAWLTFHLILRSGPGESLEIVRQARDWYATLDPINYSITGATGAMWDMILGAPGRAVELTYLLPLLPLVAPLLSSRPDQIRARTPLYAIAIFGGLAILAFRQLWVGGHPGFFSLGDVGLTMLVILAAVAVAEIVVLAIGSVRSGGSETRSPSIEVPLVVLAATAGALAIPFGSNNGPLVNLSFSLGVILVAAVVIILAGASRASAVTAAAFGLVIAIGASMIVSAGREDPYRQKPMDEQTIAAELGTPPTTFLLDPESAEYFRLLRGYAAEGGFVPGTPVLDFTDFSTAAVWALGGRTPDTVFLAFGGQTVTDSWARQALERLDIEEFGESWIITGSLDTSPDPEMVSVIGKEFPDDYVRLGDMTWWRTGETHTLWRPA